MSTILAPPIVFQGLGFGGLPLPGGKLFCYVAGTSTPQATWTDSTQLQQNTNPVILNANGQAEVWLDPTLTYKFILQDQFGNQVGVAADQVQGSLTAAALTILLPQLLYPENAAELAVPVNIANGLIPYQYVARYETNVPNLTDMALGFQNAIDSATADSAVVRFSNANVIGTPLLLRTSTQENISLSGNSRVSTAIGPNAASIAASPQNTNCIIFNQNNNTHLHLRHFEFTTQAAFNGVCIYSIEGGGADGTGQCLFSSVFEDIWMGMPITNAGFFKGGMQNCKVHTFEIEGCAVAVYNLQGVGCADIFLTNHSMVSCYDSFVSQTADTFGTIQLTVNGLNCYSHNRGVLFNVQNWIDCKVTNVSLEAATSNLGGIGLGSFTNCTNIEFSNFSAVTRSGISPANTVFSFSGCTGFKIYDGIVNGDIGIQIGGANPIDIDIDNVDFTIFSTACMAVINAGATGTLRTRNCKFNNSQLSCVLHQAVANFNWISYNDEFLNAGLGGGGSARNLNIAPGTTSTITMYNPRIGQNNGSSAAAYFVEVDGTGTVNIINPIWVGSPPTGYLTGSNAANCFITATPGYGGSVASIASITMPVNGDSITVTGTTGITSVATSAYNFIGRRMTWIFTGILTVTSGSNLKLNGNYTTSANTTLTLIFDGTNWNEVARG